MELNDLKNAWDDASDKNHQHIITYKIIDQISQSKYNSKIKSISYPEIIGSVICFLATIFIGLNFYKLNSSFLQVVGLLSILALLSISIISFLSLKQLKLTNDFSKPYAETLKIFANKKLKFLKLQKINITLCYLLLVSMIILLSKFFTGIDLTNSKYFWIFSFSFGYIFLLFYAKWVKRFYNNTLHKSEELLKELQS